MGRKLLWLASAAVLLGTAGAGVWRLKTQPYAPVQPIGFSHKVHVTDYRIECLYCHSYAGRSPFAGVPSVQRCMGCHGVVAADKVEVKKLKGYWDRKEPVPWEKVYALPRFVHFNHEAHVRARVRCQECHGPVESMARVGKVSSLEMGWCLDCHRARKASLDCVTCHY